MTEQEAIERKQTILAHLEEELPLKDTPRRHEMISSLYKELMDIDPELSGVTVDPRYQSELGLQEQPDTDINNSMLFNGGTSMAQTQEPLSLDRMLHAAVEAAEEMEAQRSSMDDFLLEFERNNARSPLGQAIKEEREDDIKLAEMLDEELPEASDSIKEAIDVLHQRKKTIELEAESPEQLAKAHGAIDEVEAEVTKAGDKILEYQKIIEQQQREIEKQKNTIESMTNQKAANNKNKYDVNRDDITFSVVFKNSLRKCKESAVKLKNTVVDFAKTRIQDIEQAKDKAVARISLNSMDVDKQMFNYYDQCAQKHLEKAQKLYDAADSLQGAKKGLLNTFRALRGKEQDFSAPEPAQKGILKKLADRQVAHATRNLVDAADVSKSHDEKMQRIEDMAEKWESRSRDMGLSAQIEKAEREAAAERDTIHSHEERIERMQNDRGGDR